MPIVAADLKVRLSGGAGNSDPDASLGGAKSSTEVVDNTTENLFSSAQGSESLPGSVKYRCEYLHNGHGSLTAQATRVYISVDTTSTDSEIDIALDLVGLNGTADTIANEDTAPDPALTFSHPTSYATGLDMGNIPAGQHFALWIRRTITGPAAAITGDATTIKYDCDTAA